MSCYKPLRAYRTATGVVFQERQADEVIGDIELPCGMCIGCRMRRASDWTLRVMHERQMHNEACAITLTYGRGNLPPNGSLEHADVQLFLKRLRARDVTKKIRYYMCGEYGEENGRPHYHMCLFGKDFSDRVPLGKSSSGAPIYNSAELHEIWGLGNVSVQDLVKETASYCARYIMKKQLGEGAKEAHYFTDDDGVIYERRAEYNRMSLKPGIGVSWFEKYGMRDVFPKDYVVSGGSKKQVPKFYEKLLKSLDKEMLIDIQSERVVNAGVFSKDNTLERRKAREIVHEAKVSRLKRTM